MAHTTRRAVIVNGYQASDLLVFPVHPPPAQQADLVKRFGELCAFDVLNPSGRYMLNLSRAIDRLVALRLQVGGRSGWCKAPT